MVPVLVGLLVLLIVALVRRGRRRRHTAMLEHARALHTLGEICTSNAHPPKPSFRVVESVDGHTPLEPVVIAPGRTPVRNVARRQIA